MDIIPLDDLHAITGLEVVCCWLLPKMNQDQKRKLANQCVVLAKEYGLSEDQIAEINNLSQLQNADFAARKASKKLKRYSYWHCKKNGNQENYLKAYEDQIDFIHRLLKGE